MPGKPSAAKLDATLQIRLHSEMAEAIKAKARENQQTANDLIRDLIAAHLAGSLSSDNANPIETLSNEFLGAAGRDMPQLLRDRNLEGSQGIILQHLLLALRRALKQPGPAADVLAVLEDKDDHPLYLNTRISPK